MKIECGLRTRETSFLQAFDPTHKIRRQAGCYYISFDSEDRGDREQFLHCFERDQILLDGVTPKQLASFDAAFNQEESVKALKDLAAARKELAGLVQAHDQAAADHVLLDGMCKENSDPARVDTLFGELKRKETAAQLAQLRLKTGERHVDALEKAFRDSISQRKKAEATRLKARLAPAVEAFNAGIEQLYATFWSAAGPLLAGIHGFEPGFPGEIFYGTPALNVAEAQAVKGLRMLPELVLRPARLEFRLKILGSAK